MEVENEAHLNSVCLTLIWFEREREKESAKIHWTGD